MKPKFLFETLLRTRYRNPLVSAIIDKEGNVIFTKPQKSITPGQSAVFYVGDIVLGRRKNTLRIKNRKE